VEPVSSAVQHIFLAVVVIAVLMLGTALALPRQPLPERGRAAPPRISGAGRIVRPGRAA